MLQLGGTISTYEVAIQKLVTDELTTRKIGPITAAKVPGTVDYLHKIIGLIRGSGFGVAIFSDLTPARTLANIFFELGVAAILGKPVQLLIAGAAAPSDFVRTEWICYDPARKTKFVTDLRRSLDTIEAGAAYYQKIGQIALEADEPDLEEAFERFKQAILISDDAKARAGLIVLQKRLRGIGRSRESPANELASHRSRLLKAINEFVGLLPKAPRRRSRAPSR